MDPRNASNFVPPSETSQRARFMSVSKIPDTGPIQQRMEEPHFPPTLEGENEYVDADAPPSPTRLCSPEPPNVPLRSDSESSDNPANDQCARLNEPNYENEHSFNHSDEEPDPLHPLALHPAKSAEESLQLTRSRSNSSQNDDVMRNIPSGIPRPPSRARDFVVPEIYEPAYLNAAHLEEVPENVVRQATRREDYQFPEHRLATQMRDPSKTPLVLVACGSFSPITYLHLRMFEMALDAVGDQTRFEVIGGYYSPVSDHYVKAGLAPAHHRVRMCELACERTSSWLMVDAWESLQPEYQRTATVLDHFNHEINVKRRGIASTTTPGGRRGVKIMLLAGGDLIESMGEPNVWMDEDLRHILGRYGCLIVERTGSDVRSFLLSHDIMYEHRHNFLVIKQLIYNDISSTKVRLFIRRNMSVQYLTPSSVIRYIYENKLYLESEPVKSVLSERGD